MEKSGFSGELYYLGIILFKNSGCVRKIYFFMKQSHLPSVSYKPEGVIHNITVSIPLESSALFMQQYLFMIIKIVF